MHFVWKMSSILSWPQCANIPQKNRSQVFPLTGFYPEALEDSRVLSSPGWVSRRAAGRAAGHIKPISALTSLGFSGSFSNAARTFKCCYDQYKWYIHNKPCHNLNTFRLYSFNHYPCDKGESIRSRNLVIPPTHATFRSRVWSSAVRIGVIWWHRTESTFHDHICATAWHSPRGSCIGSV